MKIKSVVITMFLLFTMNTAFAASSFDIWLSKYKNYAQKKGISRRTIEAAFAGVTPDPEVLKKNARQSEFVKPLSEYLDRAVSKTRISNGKKRYKQYSSLLNRISRRYGVPGKYLIAIWGMETNYGSYFGKMNVIRSLATLAYTGRRKKFGRSQLMAALRILDRGDISVSQMEGSWAGAMGNTQFIPTTYEAYAVDFDGDGRRDLWNSIPDALASTANYLAKSGWKRYKTWGMEVKLPYNIQSISGKKSLYSWNNLGVKKADGSVLPRSSDIASLLLPVGYKGPAFLVQKNFRVIKRYNNANSYALAVAYLGDQIRGGSGVITSWPKGDRPLYSREKKEVQRLLTSKGFNTYGVDGMLGPNSKRAIRAYQSKIGERPDGYAGLKLLQQLRKPF
jgi:membrane-bound lytic murein transglycosylase B